MAAAAEYGSIRLSEEDDQRPRPDRDEADAHELTSHDRRSSPMDADGGQRWARRLALSATVCGAVLVGSSLGTSRYSSSPSTIADNIEMASRIGQMNGDTTDSSGVPIPHHYGKTDPRAADQVEDGYE